MLKFISILLIGALAAAPSLVSSLYTAVWIEGDPQVNSLSKGLETCSYSSPSWIESFYSNRICIDSVFTEMNYGHADPTYQSAVKVTFYRPGFPTEVYVAANHNLSLSSTFVSGLSSVSSWLMIILSSSTEVLIFDFSTASTITIRVARDQFSVHLFSSTAFIQNGGGLMVNGCPYSSVYPWQSGYNGNPFIAGRRKRQADDRCKEVAQSYTDSLKDFQGFSFENVFKSCVSDSKFIPETPELRMKALETLKQAAEGHRKYFPEGYSAESDKNKN